MKKVINNRFLLMEYLNIVDLSSTNGQIAKFFTENKKLFQENTLSYIGKQSPFSQPTLTRFFQNACLTTYEDYKTQDIIEFQKFTDFVNFKVMPKLSNKYEDDLFLDFISKLKISKESLQICISQISNSNRVLFLSHSPILNFVFPLQLSLIYDGRISYAPQNYVSQEILIDDMKENDLIFIEKSSEEWLNSNIAKICNEKLISSPANKILITTKNIDPTDKTVNFSQIITLDNIGILYKELQLCLFFKLLSLAFLETIQQDHIQSST